MNIDPFVVSDLVLLALAVRTGKRTVLNACPSDPRQRLATMSGMETCLVAGGGPAGMMLGYLLARNGVKVTVLEAHRDFQRRFRGDTLSPAILDLLHELGLAEQVLKLPHAKASGMTWHMPDRDYKLLDYGSASKRHPYMLILSQPVFLEFLVQQAQQFPEFELRLGAKVTALLTSADGRVEGVSYRDQSGAHDLRASVVVAADGRFSKVRKLSGIASREVGVGNDLLWYQVPRDEAKDPALCGFDLFSDGRGLGSVLNHDTNWQIGFAIPVGSIAQVRDRGTEPIRAFVRNTLPWMGERIDGLTDFNQLTLLSIRITQMERWWTPGLLLIGDAAHVISPVGGYGIGLAIADAVEAANLLHPVLRRGASPAEVDRACQTLERRRRPIVEDRQRFQARLEARNNKVRARAAARIAAGKPGGKGGPRPSRFERFYSTMPWLRRWLGARATRAVGMPSPQLPRTATR